jgi:hypothetical protein
MKDEIRMRNDEGGGRAGRGFQSNNSQIRFCGRAGLEALKMRELAVAIRGRVDAGVGTQSINRQLRMRQGFGLMCAYNSIWQWADLRA